MKRELIENCRILIQESIRQQKQQVADLEQIVTKLTGLIQMEYCYDDEIDLSLETIDSGCDDIIDDKNWTPTLNVKLLIYGFLLILILTIGMFMAFYCHGSI